MDQMTDEQFLTKLKLIINGKITNAASLPYIVLVHYIKIRIYT